MYDTRSTQLGTSQGARTVKSTLGPEEGTLSARASKAVGRWLRLPGKARERATTRCVTDLQGPPSERTPEQKLWDFKTRAQQYARDRESCDDVRISYLEFLETEAEDDLALARMIAG
jgi:hypothetical protein